MDQGKSEGMEPGTERFCHRCGGELSGAEGESTFCPHCGAPQLRVLEENISPSLEPPSTGTLPPPHPGRVVWQAVIAIAALVATVSAALMIAVVWLPAAFPIAWLWTACGAVVVLGLYQRRHPETHVTAGIGARVGLVYGLMAVIALSIVTAIGALIARFGLHAMGAVDSWMAAAMHQAVEQQLQQATQSGIPAASADQLRTFYSPEVRAGLALFLLTVSASFLIAFSALGGAVGGLMRLRRR